jgi:hypothetical protein
MLGYAWVIKYKDFIGISQYLYLQYPFQLKYPFQYTATFLSSITFNSVVFQRVRCQQNLDIYP